MVHIFARFCTALFCAGMLWSVPAFAEEIRIVRNKEEAAVQPAHVTPPARIVLPTASGIVPIMLPSIAGQSGARVYLPADPLQTPAPVLPGTLGIDASGNILNAGGALISPENLLVDANGIVRDKDGNVLSTPFVTLDEKGNLIDVAGNVLANGLHIDDTGNIVDAEGSPVDLQSIAPIAAVLPKEEAAALISTPVADPANTVAVGPLALAELARQEAAKQEASAQEARQAQQVISPTQPAQVGQAGTTTGTVAGKPSPSDFIYRAEAPATPTTPEKPVAEKPKDDKSKPDPAKPASETPKEPEKKPEKQPDPSKTPQRGEAFKVPDNLAETKDLGFLEGCWVGTRPEYNTKRIIKEQFCFDASGTGKRRIFDPAYAGTCVGATRALVNSNGVLQMESEDMPCDSGESWASSTMICQGSGPKTPCKWIFSGGTHQQSYQINFVRE